ncbi:hypothetical protein, partial [Thiorhodococcus fuscus]
MYPPTESDWTSFFSINGGDAFCIDWLADHLIQFGSLANISSEMQKCVESWPDNKPYLQCLEIFLLMCDQLDKCAINRLISDLAEILKELETSKEKLKGKKNIKKVLSEKWVPIAENLTQQPPAKAGGLKLRTESPDTGR